MGLRTFYWDPVVPQKRSLFRRRRHVLRVGNAGDLFNRDLIDHLYGQTPVNTENAPRLLLVGSVVHRAQTGDIVCGVGTKGSELPEPSDTAPDLRAVRGPLTLAALEARGFSTSTVTSLADPGLYVASVYPEIVAKTRVVPGRVIFIPHYRDLPHYRTNKHYEVVSIDCEPADLVREILRSEFVYTSSLHGLIFAHALGRPAMLVAPIEGEPMLKYQDYFASIDLPWSNPVVVDEALGRRRMGSPVDVQDVSRARFAFPALDELRALGIADGDEAVDGPRIGAGSSA